MNRVYSNVKSNRIDRSKANRDAVCRVLYVWQSLSGWGKGEDLLANSSRNSPFAYKRTATDEDIVSRGLSAAGRSSTGIFAVELHSPFAICH